MEFVKIEDTDIILDDQGNGRGKIIIANTYGYNFSYFWGAMGCSLKEFLCNINKEYFAHKLCIDDNVFDCRASVKCLRDAIKEHLSYELPWYKHMEFQKDLRHEIKKIEDCQNEDEFMHSINNLSHRIMYYSIKDRYDREEIEVGLKSVLNEPWNFIEKKPSNQYIFLEELHEKLKKLLKKHKT